MTSCVLNTQAPPPRARTAVSKPKKKPSVKVFVPLVSASWEWPRSAQRKIEIWQNKRRA